MSVTSTMAPPTAPNKNLYNGGSEWQNDFSNLPDWQQTFYRNYDAVLGRWLAVDPMAEQTSDMSVYHYGANNPVMFNDPLGNLSQAQWDFALDQAFDGVTGNYYVKDGVADITEQNDLDALTSVLDRNGYGNQTGGGGGPGDPNKVAGPGGPNKGLITKEMASRLLDGSLKVNCITGKYEWTNQVATVDYETGAVGVKVIRHTGSKETTQTAEILSQTNDWLGYAGYFELGSKLTQEGMIAVPSSRITDMTKYISLYKKVGAVGEVAGKVANVGTVIDMGLNVRAYNNGEISRGRLDYRLGMTVVGVAIATYFGAIPGAIGGTAG